jgi:hypothetical protein
MRLEIADNRVGVVLYLLALVVGAALIFWGWRPSTGNSAALLLLLIVCAAFRFDTNFLRK